MASLESKLRTALREMPRTSPAATGVTAMSQRLGGNAALAREISGTSDTKSSAYKAAIRNVQRYQKMEAQAGGETRNIGAKLRDTIDAIARRLGVSQAAPQGPKDLGVTVNFSGVVVVSPGGRNEDPRDRDIPGVYIPPEAMRPVIEAVQSGDYDLAAGYFEQAFIDAWAGGLAAEIRDVDSLTMDLGYTNVSYANGGPV